MGDGKPKKAGIVIYGTNREGKRAFVMPYSEGRFGDGDKYYALPKGGIDKREDARHGAWRETEEETGLDLTKLIGEKAREAFFAGQEIEVPFNSPGYPRVRVAHIGLIPVSHAYTARSGLKRPTALFGIEVEGVEPSGPKVAPQGIDALAPYLKNREQASTCFYVKHPISNTVNNAKKYPQFNDFLEWLNTGEMPQRQWNAGQPIPAPLFTLKKREQSPIERIARKTLGAKVTTLEGWKLLFRDMNNADYDEMQKYCAAIKKAVAALGITKGDKDVIKLDDKDTPLQFFQEGADIITAEDYLKQCYKLLRANPDYALSFGGAGSSNDFRNKPRIHIRKSQFVMVAPFVPPAEMKKALSTFKLNDELGLTRAMPISETGLKAMYEFHPAFTHTSKQPDYYTSRGMQAMQEPDKAAGKG